MALTYSLPRGLDHYVNLAIATLVLSCMRRLRCGTGDRRRAFAVGGDLAVGAAQELHHSWELGEPDERASPPDFVGECYGGICAAGLLTVAKQQAHLQ